MKKIWVSSGLLIIGFLMIGVMLDNLLDKENVYVFAGFGVGLIVSAILVLTKPKNK
ncbi:MULTISPECIES: hypothetical protein [Mesonia]|uniref:Uncharacterized protein n=1 Tax=Mesonia oceanica TaxID=2687242 RepID=A0AC61Y5T6_9FLAO|nr:MULTISPECIES: hypothetical protein [Mesonia]VVU99860.1 hypothetical protein FVB9532_01121 [Mesonia oceanica]|tara:strand:+ start:789 stop:956 length:168 start_codon:yes stop_codon:yes gene_type:complete